MSYLPRNFNVLNYRHPRLQHYMNSVAYNTITSYETERKIAECCKELNIPKHSKLDEIRKAYVELAKRFHPDSGTAEASNDKFCSIENAYRYLCEHNASCNAVKEEIIEYDIKHTAPQHRQYLSYSGVGSGPPCQRERQWAQVRAQKAANNVMEHKIAKAIASESTLVRKDVIPKKHVIKTKCGFDRLVEDLIQESISKGEFENLSGNGKPLRDQIRNPYVDFTTHKLNEVLINNGFTPEWITMNKDLNEEIKLFKKELGSERRNLGPYPLDEENETKWRQICKIKQKKAKSINCKINTFNLIVPLINKQKFHLNCDNICDEILKNGEFTNNIKVCDKIDKNTLTNEDVLKAFINAIKYLFFNLLKRSRNKNNSQRIMDKKI